MTAFLAGGHAVAAGAVALFFFRYWRATGDRLFAFFAAAFAVFAANRVLFFAIGDTSDFSVVVYVVRLVGFLLILAGIAAKNYSDLR